MESERHKESMNKRRWNDIYRKEGYEFEVDKNIDSILAIFEENSVERVLDLGFGSGRHTVHLAKRGFDVYGIDISTAGAKKAKQQLTKNGLKANLSIGSIYKKLPYKDSLFDAIISIRTLNHAKIKSIHKTIKEMKRVLKPKGLIFVTVRKRISKKLRVPYKDIAPRTYIPLEGKEKGVIHYSFNKSLLRKEFRNFKIYDLWIDDENYYCLLGELKDDWM